MPGRLLIILRAEDADAVMKGGSTNRHGNVNITDLRGTAELWAGEADDKGIYLTKIHGGEKKVAEASPRPRTATILATNRAPPLANSRHLHYASPLFSHSSALFSRNSFVCQLLRRGQSLYLYVGSALKRCMLYRCSKAFKRFDLQRLSALCRTIAPASLRCQNEGWLGNIFTPLGV